MNPTVLKSEQTAINKIPLAVPPWGEEEIEEAIDSLKSGWLTMGAKVRRFEEMFAKYIGVPEAVMVNSGSSANLVALTALNLARGDEVITPALTWATTVFPICQVGAVPVLVDVDLRTLNMDPASVASAITSKTRAIMLVHFMGNPCLMDAYTMLAKQYNLSLVEDCCEALGTTYRGKKVGGFGLLSTFSFFMSHHLSTIEGGMIVGSDPKLMALCRSLRAHGWAREEPDLIALAEKHPDIDPRFLIINSGYNLRPTEIQGAFGIHQMDKLQEFLQQRRKNAAYFSCALARYGDWLQLPTEDYENEHSWLGYPVVIKPNAPFTRKELTSFLEAKGLETRTLMAGNIVEQPVMSKLSYRVGGSLTNAHYLHRNGFYFGCHQGIGIPEREAIVAYFDEFLRSIK